MIRERQGNQESVLKLVDRLIRAKSSKKFVIGLGLLGILLIFLSSFIKTGSMPEIKTTQCTTEEYVKQMQSNLETLVSKIEGAGEAQVMVTLENGSETVYAKEEKKNKECSEDKAPDNKSSKVQQSDDLQVKYITMRDSDGTEKALMLKQMEPTIKGVVVVCRGGNKKEVRVKVVEAVKTALDITEKRVCVIR
ncbi:MAG: hypothetical protein LBH37_02475 [Oscillospiraceae bacterium]|jgi:stage III sporulation protein AG|nr:hypothetical protein [Oscillospiraceae bacterium]